MSNTIDRAIRNCDATKAHEIVIKTENYLNSIGKNNSTGKYDRVVHGVKSLLSSGYLEGAALEKAIKQEADRLLKKYNANDRSVEAIRMLDGTSFSSITKSFESKTKQILEMKDNAEAKNKELDRAFNSYLNDLNDVFNTMSKEMQTEREKMFEIKKKANAELFRAYKNK